MSYSNNNKKVSPSGRREWMRMNDEDEVNRVKFRIVIAKISPAELLKIAFLVLWIFLIYVNISLTYQQSVFRWYHSNEHYKSFTHKMAAKTSWHRYGTKLRHRHPMNWFHVRRTPRSELSMGWVGLGWVGSHKMDPWTTLAEMSRTAREFSCVYWAAISPTVFATQRPPRDRKINFRSTAVVRPSQQVRWRSVRQMFR